MHDECHVFKNNVAYAIEAWGWGCSCGEGTDSNTHYGSPSNAFVAWVNHRRTVMVDHAA